MRALLVSPSSAPGGAERALAALAARLPAVGIEVRAILLQPGPLEQWLAEANCRVEVIDARRTRHVHRTAWVIARLAAPARAADVVISNQSKGHVYGGAAARVAGRPAVWWQQGIPEHSRIDLVAARISAALIVASSVEAVKAQERLTPHRRVALAHLGIDVDGVRAHQGTGEVVRATHRWTTGPIVGIVGRLQEWKGQDVFLRAAARVAKAHPSATFVIVGGAVLGWEGDYPQRLKNLAGDLGIADRVYFAGHQDDIYPWFDALDVVVHASYGEPFGLVLVEAMALGKPLTATAAGGPLEIIEEGISGLLVPPGDDEAMAAAMTKVLDDATFRDTLGAGARERAEHFSDVRMAERFASLLHDIAAPSRPRPCKPAPSGPLEERTVPGLHDYVYRNAVTAIKPGPALDLGAGSGAFAERLTAGGFDVLAVDRDAATFRAPVPFRSADLDSPGWGESLGLGQWSLVTAVEVIEHMEAPVAFLRNIATLLAPDGRAVITTPNVDSLPARLKFLFRDKLRMLDEHGDPTHISPIFWDLLIRQYLPLAGLRLVSATTYPVDGFVAGRPSYGRVLQLARPVLARRPRLLGDNHVLVLARVDDTG